MAFDLETIGLIGAAAGAVVKYFKSQTQLVEVARHLSAQNTDILGRQTAILARLTAVMQHIVERVEALEGEGADQEETQVTGFRVGDDEDDGDEDDEAEPEPVNEGAKAVARRGKR